MFGGNITPLKDSDFHDNKVPQMFINFSKSKVQISWDVDYWSLQKRANIFCIPKLSDYSVSLGLSKKSAPSSKTEMDEVTGKISEPYIRGATEEHLASPFSSETLFSFLIIGWDIYIIDEISGALSKHRLISLVACFLLCAIFCFTLFALCTKPKEEGPIWLNWSVYFSDVLVMISENFNWIYKEIEG